MYECCKCIYYNLWEECCERTGEKKDWADGCYKWEQETYEDIGWE